MKKTSRMGHGAPDANAIPNETFEPTVLAWRPLDEWGDARGQVIRSDASVAEFMLDLVRATAAAAWDEPRLLDVIQKFAFRAFPNASHLVLAERDADGQLQTRMARTRDSGDAPEIQLSRTITDRVLRDGCALLFAHDQGRRTPAESVVQSGLETAICAPLLDRGVARGVLQLDVRRPARGCFTREDVDLLSVFATQVGLVLELEHMVQQQRRAFESTVYALVNALALRDPDSAGHSQRVRLLALGVGRQLGYGGTTLDTLGWAALLHDLGTKGLHHQTFIRPGRITPEDHEAISRRAEATQSIIDLIQYPESLRDVPRIAAHLHTKPDADADPATSDVRTLAQIIFVADVCDALLRPRGGKDALPPSLVKGLLVRGKDSDWEARVVDAACDVLEHVLAEIAAVEALEEQRPAA
jgi:HD-GYP domain-containing protein (c-di-GMP phosphodiesterase class II)